jgi:hypothetical protein
MLLSDSIGVAAGVCLAIPPLKDQGGRLREWHHAAKETTAVPVIRQLLVNALRTDREAFSGFDTLFLAIGSIGLLVSFGLKLFNQ